MKEYLRSNRIAVLYLLLFMCSIMSMGKADKELLPSSETFITIAKESLPAVVSIRVTKKTEKLVLKKPGDSKPKGESGESPYELFEKFFGEEMPYLFEEKEMEVPAAGSGLIVSPDGFIITNNHVIAEAKEGTIEIKLNDGTTVKGKDVQIVGTDPLTDLAVIKIKAKDLKTIPWGKSEDLEIGEWVLAMGNPFDLSGSVTQGIISAKHRIIHKAVLEDMIQTTAVINPGNSGGPLINLAGEVVGINTAIATESGIWQGIGFAIPSKIARRVAEEIIQYGQVQQGWIGIFMRPITKDIASFYDLDTVKGIFVMNIIPDSPAEKSGIKKDDLIIKMNGDELENPLDLLKRTASKTAGEKVNLSIIRLEKGEKKEMTVELELGQRPAEKELATIHQPRKLSMTYDTLGLRVNELGDGDIKGVEIVDVKGDSPAEKAGLASGDVLIEINSRPIHNLDDYNNAIASLQKERLLIRFLRSGSEEIAIVKLK